MSKRHHPASRRQPHTPEQQDDAFVAGVMDMSRWVSENRQLLVLGGVVLVLLISGGLYYVNFQRSVATQAMNQLESIHQSISISAFEDAKAQLSTFVDRFEGTNQAREAVVLLGRLHLEAGDAAVAISVLERGIEAYLSADYEAALALFQDALRLEPEHAVCLHNIQRIQKRLGRAD